MSKHKIPLTPLEEEGMKAHGLAHYIGKPSQLTDVFRQGIAWALENTTPPASQESAGEAVKRYFPTVTEHPSPGAWRWPDYWRERMVLLYSETGSYKAAARIITEESGRACSRQAVAKIVQGDGPRRHPRFDLTIRQRARELRAEIHGGKPISYARIALILSLETGREVSSRLVFYWLTQSRCA